jgi:hypothetical protein
VRPTLSGDDIAVRIRTARSPSFSVKGTGHDCYKLRASKLFVNSAVYSTHHYFPVRMIADSAMRMDSIDESSIGEWFAMFPRYGALMGWTLPAPGIQVPYGGRREIGHIREEALPRSD